MISTKDSADANDSFFYLEVVTLEISERTYSHSNVHEYSTRCCRDVLSLLRLSRLFHHLTFNKGM
jgi:hypothetical protein